MGLSLVRLSKGCAVSLCAVVALGALPASGAPTRAARACKRGLSTLRLSRDGGTIAPRGSGRRVCVKLPRAPSGSGLDLSHRLAAQVLRDPRLYRDRRLRRLRGRLRAPAGLRRLAEQRTTISARTRTTGTRTTAGPDGERIVEELTNVSPDSAELGLGSGIRSTVTGGRAQRAVSDVFKEMFVRRCPDADGNVAGDFSTRQTIQTSTVTLGVRGMRHGIRVVVFVGMEWDGTLQAHVSDAARITDFRYDARGSLEVRASIEDAGSGRLIGRSPTKVFRVTSSLTGIDPRNPRGVSGLDDPRWTWNGRGPRGNLGEYADGLYTLAAGLMDDAIVDDASRWFLLGETIFNDNARCLDAVFTPPSLRLGLGEPAPVQVSVRHADEGVEVPMHLRAEAVTVYPGDDGDVSPKEADARPGARAGFTYTAPNWNVPDGAALRVDGVSKRGRVTGGLHVDLIVPHRFRITFAGTGHQQRDEPPYVIHAGQGDDLVWSLHQDAAMSWRVVYADVLFPADGRAPGFAHTDDHSVSGSYHSTGLNASNPFDCGDAIAEADTAQRPLMTSETLGDGTYLLELPVQAEGLPWSSDNDGCAQDVLSLPGAWTMWDDGANTARTTAFVTVTPGQLERGRFTVPVQATPEATRVGCSRHTFGDPSGGPGCTLTWGWTGTVAFDPVP